MEKKQTKKLFLPIPKREGHTIPWGLHGRGAPGWVRRQGEGGVGKNLRCVSTDAVGEAGKQAQD